MIVYFEPTHAPKLVSTRIDNNKLICQYDTFAPFNLKYETRLESDPDNSSEFTTINSTNKVVIDTITSRYSSKFSIRARCVLSKIFHSESPFCDWTVIDPINNDQQSYVCIYCFCFCF